MRSEDVPIELSVIKSFLGMGEKHGLQAEVVYYALMEMKANPNLSINDAMINAWDKLESYR